MTWLTPWSAFWLLVGTVPVLLALYILRLRRARQVVPSILMWIESKEDLQANTPFQRLRRNILLLLQLIALLLLGLAMAGGRLESPEGRGASSALIIDRSASMQAVDQSGRTRFEQAIAAAHGAVDRLHPDGWFGMSGGRTMIIGVADEAEVLQPFTSSASTLHAALDRMEPVDTDASVQDGLDLARASSINPDPEAERADAPAVRVELFTDGGLIDLEQASDRREDVRVHLIGQAADNVAVRSVAADRLPEDQDMVQVFASLENHDQIAQTVAVQLSVNGLPMAVEDLEIPGRDQNLDQPGRRDVVFTPRMHPGDVLFEVKVLREDALSTDNAGWAVAAAPRTRRVLLISDRDLMNEAMGVIPGVAVEQFNTLPQDPTLWRAADLVIFDQVEPSMWPDLPTMSIDTSVPSSRVTWLGRGADTRLLTADVRHPAMDTMPPDLWVAAPQSLQPDASVRVLAESLQGPLILAWEESSARRLHIAFDPATSSWPWDASFITTLMDSVDWLTRRGTDASVLATASGNRVTAPVPGDASQVEIIRPDGFLEPTRPVSSGTVTFGPAQQHGPWLLRWNGPNAGRQYVVVSMPVVSESDLRVPEALRIGQQQSVLAAAPSRGSAPVWPWALGAALIVLILEWAIYCRRIS
ncbi:MAG: VWA domain-containing protein [Phycisphaerales bacterium]|nr:VWA domain-containing protein [Phycisphaerales bacterium]